MPSEKKTLDAYGRKRTATGGGKMVELSEVGFLGGYKDMQRLADFFSKAASEMKVHGKKFGHSHLRDQWKNWSKKFPDIIVARKP